MRIAFLYALVVVIWGSTWATIPYQLGVVAEEISVAYRFAIGSLILFIYAAVRGNPLGIPLRHYGYIVLMGALMFSLSYLFVYHATAYITSGLVAVVFSLIVVSNALCEKLFFRRPFDARLTAASVCGVIGIALVFWPEVSAFELGDKTIAGVLLVLASVLIASLGNMAAIVNTAGQLSVVSVNAHAMAWGAVMSSLTALFLGNSFGFSWEPGYVLSLLYLAVFGSSIAFGCYLALLKSIGSARAAYTSVLFPLVALSISTFVEDYRWTPFAVAGIAMILAGNWLALTKIKRT